MLRLDLPAHVLCVSSKSIVQLFMDGSSIKLAHRMKEPGRYEVEQSENLDIP